MSLRNRLCTPTFLVSGLCIFGEMGGGMLTRVFLVVCVVCSGLSMVW